MGNTPGGSSKLDPRATAQILGEVALFSHLDDDERIVCDTNAPCTLSKAVCAYHWLCCVHWHGTQELATQFQGRSFKKGDVVISEGRYSTAMVAVLVEI